MAQPAEELSTGAKVTINGYLTQAYAKSDAHQFLGITEAGTANYTTAALRVQIPFGIYNEVRDLGTVLPFYRPSHNFYGDAAFGSETLEGVVLTHRQELGAGWTVTGDLHYGNWRFGNRDFNGDFHFDSTDRSKGIELWIDTPVSGLRVGGGTMRYDIRSGKPEIPIVGKSPWQASHVSLSGEFDRFNGHAEVKEADLGAGFRAQMGYAQVGVRLLRSLTLNVQRDILYLKTTGQERVRFDDDRALGLN